MAYRFKLKESLGHEVRRIASEQIEKAVRTLSSGADSVAVHETRRCLKRTRALLRLAKPGLGHGAFKRENVRLRDAGRLLSSARDATVVAQVAERLSKQPGLEGDPALARLVKLAARHKDAALAAAVDRDGAQALLRAFLEDCPALVLEPDSFEPIGEGLGEVYRGCRAGFSRAFETGTDEDFHDWRKSVQAHWRHMRLLARAWPDYFEARARLASELAGVLGRAQDLSVLAEFIEKGPVRGIARKECARIVALCREEQARERAAALHRGRLLTIEGAGGHVRRAAQYWACAVEAAHSRRERPAEAKAGADRQGS